MSCSTLLGGVVSSSVTPAQFEGEGESEDKDTSEDAGMESNLLSWSCGFGEKVLRSK